jgi:predicted transposase/invertase (TIGR01784 family)
MKRDPLFFSLFKELPGCFFQLVGKSEKDAENYELDAIEYKSISVRLDGVFRPRNASVGPAYLWEAQYYASDTVYANLLTKIGSFLERSDPKQDWVVVVIYPNRALEQKNLHPFRCLLDSDQCIRIYLDELPPALPDRFEMRVLELIAAKPEAALEKARDMVPRVKASKWPKQFQRMLLELIETVIVYQFPKWSREKVETMLQVTDITQTRVYQEAFEEGREREKETMARRFLKMGLSVADVMRGTGLTAEQVRKLSKKSRK